MPIEEIHQRKKAKNYAVLVILLAVMAVFFVSTIVKFKEIAEKNAANKIKSEQNGK